MKKTYIIEDAAFDGITCGIESVITIVKNSQIDNETSEELLERLNIISDILERDAVIKYKKDPLMTRAKDKFPFEIRRKQRKEA